MIRLLFWSDYYDLLTLKKKQNNYHYEIEYQCVITFSFATIIIIIYKTGFELQHQHNQSVMIINMNISYELWDWVMLLVLQLWKRISRCFNTFEDIKHSGTLIEVNHFVYSVFFCEYRLGQNCVDNLFMLPLVPNGSWQETTTMYW